MSLIRFYSLVSFFFLCLISSAQGIKTYPQWAGIIEAKSNQSIISYYGADVDYLTKKLNLLSICNDTINIDGLELYPLMENGGKVNSLLITCWNENGKLDFSRMLGNSDIFYDVKIKSNIIDSGYFIYGTYSGEAYWDGKLLDTTFIPNALRFFIASYDPMGNVRFIKSYQTFIPNSSCNFTLFPNGNKWYILDANYNGLPPLNHTIFDAFNFPYPWQSAIFTLEKNGNIDSGFAIPRTQNIACDSSGFWIGSFINENYIQQNLTALDSGFAFGSDTLKGDYTFYITHTKNFIQFDSIIYFTKYNSSHLIPFKTYMGDLFLASNAVNSTVVRDSMIDEYKRNNGSKLTFSKWNSNGLSNWLSNTYQNQSGSYCFINNLQGYDSEIWSMTTVSAGCYLDNISFNYTESGLMKFSTDIHVDHWLTYYFGNSDNPWSFWLENNRFYHVGQMNYHEIGINGKFYNAKPGSLCILMMDTAFVDMSLGIKQTNKSAWKLQPNPTDGLITISTNSNELLNYQISIINLQGQPIKGYPISIKVESTDINLNIGDNPPGVYFIGLETSLGWSWQKVVLF